MTPKYITHGIARKYCFSEEKLKKYLGFPLFPHHICGESNRKSSEDLLKVHNSDKKQQMNRMYSAHRFTWKPFDGRTRLHYIVDTIEKIIAFSVSSVLATHKALGVYCYKKQLWRRSHTLLTLSNVFGYNTSTHTLISVLHTATVCPRCIYTHTSYGLFTSVAHITHHYYYYYSYNNHR